MKLSIAEIVSPSTENKMRPTEAPVWLLGPPRHRVLRPAGVQPGAERPRLTAVFNFRDNPGWHFIRLDDMLVNKHLSNSQMFSRLNLNSDLWSLNVDPDYVNVRQSVEMPHLSSYPVRPELGPSGNFIGPSGGAAGSSGARGRRPAPHGPGGGAVWGAWAAGAVLLVLLVLFVRAAEKCVDKRLFKARRRRQSEEWPAANVTATSLQQQNIDLDPFSNLDELEFSSSNQRNSDLPPPYSECASNNDVISNVTVKNINKISTEEPPPPYSACLVSFFNKDIPTVHIHRRQSDEPQTSSNIDHVNTDLMEARHLIGAGESYNADDTIRVELVFDNGRVVERTIDIDSTDNVPDIVANVGDIVIGNRNVDDAVICTDENDQDRVILV